MKHYTVKKGEKDSWQLFTPDGKPFFSLGVDCVTPPEGADIWMNETATKEVDWFPRFMNGKLLEMQAAGFNTLGAWHNHFYWGNQFPKTVEIRMSTSSVKVNKGWGMGFPDVFDPSFEISARRETIRTLYADGGRLLNDAGLIGCYTDNELHWWGSSGYWGDNEQAERGGSCTALVDDYISQPETSYGKQRWVALLKERHGTIENLNAHWGAEYSDFEDLLIVKRYRSCPEAIGQDKEAFLRLIARTYFEITSSLLNTYLPGRLNLGCRYVGNSTPDIVLEEGGRVVDIDAFNFYSIKLPTKYLQEAYAITKKPMMITEFCFCAGRSAGFLDSTNGARNVTVLNQERRGECYAQFLSDMRELPFMLGAHWFSMFDFGHGGGGLNGNYGLYDLSGRPYEGFIEQVSKTNLNLK